MAYIGKRPVDTFPANNAVTSSLISENAVGSSEIATNAVTTLQIADNAVTAVKIAENVISSRELAANTVATGNIADNAVDGTKIAQNSILTRHIDDGQVTTDQLGADAVTAAKLADDAVVTANIVDNAVTAAKLNISGNGTAGQALLSDGDGSFSYGAGGKTTEEVQDIVGAMFSSNTETGITATYEDGDGTVDLVVGTLNQDTTGNAATATALETARTIHGVSFDGTANIDLSEVVQDTAGAMFSSNTETNVTATYQDSDGTIDLAVEQQLNNTSAPYFHKIVVTVVSSGGNKYALDGGTQAVAKLTPNVVYRFDQSDSSNSGHPLRIGTAANSSEITAGFTIYNKVGTPGNAGAYTEVALEQDAPGQLYYWCSIHSGMGASVSVADESFLTQTLTNKTIASPAVTGTATFGGTTDGVSIGQGFVKIKNGGTQSYVDLYCESSNAHYLRLQAPAHSAFSGNPTVTLPATTGTLALTTGSVATVTTAAQPNITSLGTLTTLTVDDISIDGSTISDAGVFKLDIGSHIILDADGGNIYLSDGGTDVGVFQLSNNSVVIRSLVSDEDIIFKGNDGGSAITALTLDMSDAGSATFNNNVTVSGNLTVSGSTTTVSSTNTTIADRLIELGTGTSGTPANDMGIVLERGDSDNAFIGWDESTDKFIVGTGSFTGSSTGNLTISTGTLVANLEGNVTGNLTGTASAIADNSVTSAKIVNGTIVAADIANATITTTQIAANTIATGNVADNAIDGTKIAQDSILTRHIDDAQVTTAKIGDLQVNTSKLANFAVSSAKIADANVTTAKLADDAVTAAKITDNAVGAAALNISGNGTSGQAILSDGDGSFSYGSSGKTTEEIQDIVGAMFSSNTETNITVTYQDSDGTVDLVVPNELSSVTELGTLTTLRVDDIRINGTQIGHISDEDAMSIASNGVVTFTQIPVLPNDSIAQANIADDAVGADQLAANSVVSASIVNGSIVSADIAANTIATSNIADNAVDGSKIASNSILTRHIDDNQVTGDQIGDDVVLSGTGAVTLPKGTTAQRPSGTAGEFRFNTTTSKFEGHNGSEFGEIGGGGSSGFLTDIFDGSTTPATDGSRVAFTMSQSVSDEKFVMVFVDGVYQAHSAYSVSGDTLTMADAPVAGRTLTVHSVSAAVQGDGLNVDNFSGDGSDTTFTLSLNPSHENNTQVYIDGVYQFKNTYSVSGTTLTFSSAPPNGSAIEVMTHSQTTVNNAASLAATAISGLSEVTIAGADHVMIFDATDSTLKKGLASDLIEQLTTEQVQDVVGAMVSSNTETGVAVSYEDGDGTLDFVLATAQPTVTSLGTLTSLGVNSGTTNTVATFTSTDAGANITLTDSSNRSTIEQNTADLIIHSDPDGSTGSSQIKFMIDGGTKALVNAAGNVGIGTTSPGEALTVEQSNSGGQTRLRVKNTANASNSHTRLILQTGGTSGGDSILNFDAQATGAQYTIGADVSDTSFKITKGDRAAFDGTDEFFILDDGGDLAIKHSARITQSAITSSSNAVAWNAKTQANAYHVTTENTTFSAPSNAVEGAIIQVEIAQGGTARTIAWNTVFEFAASTAPTVTATANKTDIFTFRYNGSVWQEIGRVQNLAQT